MLPVDLGRDLAARIPGAKYIEYLEGGHAFWFGDAEAPARALLAS
jgi:hypothetical protein